MADTHPDAPLSLDEALTWEPRPWEQQPFESSRQWAAFRAYRDLAPGSRTMAGVARVLGRGSVSPDWARWRREDSWDARCALFDQLQDRQRQEGYLRAREAQSASDAAARDRALLDDAVSLLWREVGKYLIQARESDFPVMKPGELQRLLDSALKLRRLLYGEATERVEAPPVDLSALSADQLEQLIGLLESAEAGAEPAPVRH